MKFVVTVLFCEPWVVSGYYNNNDDKKDMSRATSILNLKETSSTREIFDRYITTYSYVSAIVAGYTNEQGESLRKHVESKQ